jgi:Na+-transporting NADH:ubiquinone oxidoreductase subunit NqrE
MLLINEPSLLSFTEYVFMAIGMTSRLSHYCFNNFINYIVIVCQDVVQVLKLPLENFISQLVLLKQLGSPLVIQLCEVSEDIS